MGPSSLVWGSSQVVLTPSHDGIPSADTPAAPLPHLHSLSRVVQPGMMLWEVICKLTPVT